jgi:predicted transposase YbfD/YdcC
VGAGGCDSLLAHLASVPDPRKPRGVRYGLCSLLAVAAAAVLAGARSFTAIGEWAADASQQVLATLGVRPHRRSGAYVAPDEATVRRALQTVDADAVDDAIAGWLASREGPDEGDDGGVEGIALDGKTVRGARHRDSDDERAPHLVSAVSHRDGIVLAQRQVDSKSNEITAVRPLLAGLDLVGKVITADALHTQRAFADWLVTDKKADYLLIVKANQPTLLDTVATALTGTDKKFADRMHSTTNRGHGRTETRTIRTAPAAGIDFPHDAQVFRLRRDRGGLDGVRTSKEIVYGITSLHPDQAGPAQIATHTRQHWTIENGLHHVRDVTWGEDASQVRTGNAPRVMAGLRTSPSVPYAKPAPPTSPKRYATTPATTADPSSCSASTQSGPAKHRPRLCRGPGRLGLSLNPWTNRALVMPETP